MGHITNKIIDILHLLIQATNIEQKPLIQVPIEEKLEGPRGIMSNDPMNDVIPLGSNTLNHAIKAYTQRHSAEKKNSQIYWPKPLEINFLLIKDADDVATIYCKIGGLVIPS